MFTAACEGGLRSTRKVEQDSVPTRADGDTSSRRPSPLTAPSADSSLARAVQSCDIEEELADWSAKVFASGEYATHVVLQIARMETGSGDRARSADTASEICNAARGRTLSEFLRLHRALTDDRTVLDTAFVRHVTARKAAIGAPANRPQPVVSASDTSLNANAEVVVPEVTIPTLWMIGIVVVTALAAASIVGALWREGRRTSSKFRELHRAAEIRTSALTLAIGGVEKSSADAKVLLDSLAPSQVAARDEAKHALGLLRTEVAKLREQIASGTATKTALATGAAHLRTERDPGALHLDRDPYGHADRREERVDVRSPRGGGPTTVTADAHGLFLVRWSASDEPATLVVDPAQTLGAAFGDRLDAAFRRQGSPRGSHRYRTIEPAACSWDPVEKQGRVTHKGLVEEE